MYVPADSLWTKALHEECQLFIAGCISATRGAHLHSGSSCMHGMELLLDITMQRAS